MATFGERFRQLRNEKKLTQDKLAEKFFLNKSSISRYENNEQIPEIESLQAFADFFDVSIDYLLGKSEIRNNNDLKIPPAYLRVAKDALRKGVSPEDLDFAIDFLIKARQKDEDAKKGK